MYGTHVNFILLGIEADLNDPASNEPKVRFNRMNVKAHVRS